MVAKSATWKNGEKMPAEKQKPLTVEERMLNTLMERQITQTQAPAGAALRMGARVGEGQSITPRTFTGHPYSREDAQEIIRMAKTMRSGQDVTITNAKIKQEDVEAVANNWGNVQKGMDPGRIPILGSRGTIKKPGEAENIMAKVPMEGQREMLANRVYKKMPAAEPVAARMAPAPKEEEARKTVYDYTFRVGDRTFVVTMDTPLLNKERLDSGDVLSVAVALKNAMKAGSPKFEGIAAKEVTDEGTRDVTASYLNRMMNYGDNTVRFRNMRTHEV